MKLHEKLFRMITLSSVFRLDGAEIDLLFYLEGLAADLDDRGQIDWDLGEFAECTLGDLIVGAYWALAPRRGELHSKADRAFIALSKIYKPNMVRGVEEGTGEAVAAELIIEALSGRDVL